jgi:hypothetical protein
MFNSFFNRREKERSVKLFSKYIDRKMVVKLSATDNIEGSRNNLSEGSVEYVFVLIEADSANETARQLGSVAKIAQESGWMVQAFVCNVVVLVSGTLLIEQTVLLERSSLVGKLIETLASNVKIVHGQEIAHFGLMGSDDRLTYGVLLPSFVTIVTLFNSVPLGQACEHPSG